VVEHNGCRVMGVLSMSRAIGDRWLLIPKGWSTL
jgi:hypothetical protein